MKKIARKAHVREASFTGAVWVEVDVHKKSYAIAILDKQEISTSFSMPADIQALVTRLRSVPNQVACGAYEAGPCGYSLYRAAREVGPSALMAAPSRIPRPVTLEQMNFDFL